MSVRLPRLLDGNMQEVRRLHPSALSAQLNLQPLSTASMCLPEGEEGVGVRAFVEVYGPDGSLGVYRVASIGTSYGTEQRVNLEHGITTLGDDVTGADTELKGSVLDIMSAILACQSTVRWVLGTVEATGEDYTLPVNRSNVLDALLSASELEEGCMLSFDQSAYPWTVSLRKMDSVVASECRISRNMAGVTISLDDASLCTRVYSEYLPDGYMDADTVAAWGVVAQGIALEEPVEAGDEVDLDNRETARRYLDENKNPAVSIEIDAVELSGLTGEPLDSFSLGRVCRVALPDYGVTMDERMVGMSYGDLLNAPEIVRLTLSTPQKNASVALASLRQQVRVTTKRVLEQHKHITETENELLLHAELINAKAESVEVTAIGKRVSQAEVDIDALGAEIELKASVERVAGLESRVTNAEIDIDGANGAIALKASQAQLDSLQGDVEENIARIDLTYDSILEQILLNGEVMTEINKTVEGIDAWSKDTEGNLADLLLAANAIKGQVSDVEGNVGTLMLASDEFRTKLQSGDTVLSEIRQLQDAISQTVNDANGNIGALTVKADGITGKVTNVESNVGRLLLASDEFRTTLQNGDTVLSEILQLQDAISQTVDNGNGSIGALKVMADNITQRVEDANKGVGQFQTTADRISGSVQALDGRIGELELTSDHFGTKITGLDGRVGELELTSDHFDTKITGLDGRVGELELTSDHFDTTITGLDGRVGKLELRSDSFDVAIGKDGLGGKINMIEGLLDLKVEGGGNTVSVRLDAFDNSISLKADTTYVNELVADEIKAVKGSFDELLAGYVTTEAFEAVTGWTENFAGHSISADYITCGTGDFDDLVFGTLAGENCSWKSKSVLVSRGNVSVSKRYLTLMKGDGTTVTLDIVTDVSLSNSRSETINYLGKD